MAKAKKPRIEPLTAEQVTAARLERELREVRIQMNRTGNRVPTIHFEVGEVIQYGSLDKTTVLESFDEGRIYRVHCYSLNGKGSQNPGGIHSNDERIMAWHDMHKTTECATDNFFFNDDMRLESYQTSIDGLINTYYHFGIDMDPEYQRGLVWTLEDKVNLIDSIFNHIDIGKFSLINLPFRSEEAHGYEILDGKQRLNAIIEFYEGRFTYRGRTFRQLSWRDQSHFERYLVAKSEVRDEKVTLAMKCRYFLKLNTTGRPQDPTHIAKVRELYLKSISPT